MRRVRVDAAADGLVRAHAVDAGRQRGLGGKCRACLAQCREVALEILATHKLEFLQRDVDEFCFSQHLRKLRRSQREAVGSGCALRLQPCRELVHGLGRGRRCAGDLGLEFRVIDTGEDGRDLFAEERGIAGESRDSAFDERLGRRAEALEPHLEPTGAPVGRRYDFDHAAFGADRLLAIGQRDVEQHRRVGRERLRVDEQHALRVDAPGFSGQVLLLARVRTDDVDDDGIHGAEPPS